MRLWMFESRTVSRLNWNFSDFLLLGDEFSQFGTLDFFFIDMMRITDGM